MSFPYSTRVSSMSRVSTSRSPAGGAVGARLAVVGDPDGVLIGEVTARGQAGGRSFGFSGEVAVVGGVSERWSSLAVGNLVLEGRGILGRGSTHALGLRGTVPLGQRGGALGPVAYWGSVPAATVPGGGLALVYGGATARVVWDLHAGLRLAPEGGFAQGGWLDLGVSVATVPPMGRGWDGVAEVEAMTGPSPVHVRALVRRRVGPATLEVGIGVPVVAMIRDPSLQIVAGIRGP